MKYYVIIDNNKILSISQAKIWMEGYDTIEYNSKEVIDFDKIEGYEYISNSIVFNKDLYDSFLKEKEIKELREKREIECFAIIDRSQLWYNSLNETQINELTVWYNNWLNVTETLIIPEKPTWL